MQERYSSLALSIELLISQFALKNKKNPTLKYSKAVERTKRDLQTHSGVAGLSIGTFKK